MTIKTISRHCQISTGEQKHHPPSQLRTPRLRKFFCFLFVLTLSPIFTSQLLEKSEGKKERQKTNQMMGTALVPSTPISYTVYVYKLAEYLCQVIKVLDLDLLTELWKAIGNLLRRFITERPASRYFYNTLKSRQEKICPTSAPSEF